MNNLGAPLAATMQSALDTFQRLNVPAMHQSLGKDEALKLAKDKAYAQITWTQKLKSEKEKETVDLSAVTDTKKGICDILGIDLD